MMNTIFFFEGPEWSQDGRDVMSLIMHPGSNFLAISDPRVQEFNLYVENLLEETVSSLGLKTISCD